MCGRPRMLLMYPSQRRSGRSQSRSGGGTVLTPGTLMSWTAGPHGSGCRTPPGATFSLWSSQPKPGYNLAVNNVSAGPDLSTSDSGARRQVLFPACSAGNWPLDEKEPAGYIHIIMADFNRGFRRKNRIPTLFPIAYLHQVADVEARRPKPATGGAKFLSSAQMENCGTMSIMATPKAGVCVVQVGEITPNHKGHKGHEGIWVLFSGWSTFACK